MSRIGVVAIGRNEGDRLARSLGSVRVATTAVVYVDSGSTDGSVAIARGMDVEVVELDPTRPLTAARARNAGFDHLITRSPQLSYVFFMDGDCELAEGFLDVAGRTLDERADVAVVCGRRRERSPEATIYNRLCDMEWDTPLGEAAACGGDALVRASAFREAGGFDASLIAGEEPELCVRLRRRGWKVLRIAAEMTLHDAAMSRFGQWWRRARRGGHAYAEGAAMHGTTDRHFVRQTLSALVWGGLLPLAILVCLAAGAFWPPGLAVAGVLALGYPVLLARIVRFRRHRGDRFSHALTYAVFCIIGKFAEATGLIAYGFNRMRGRQTRIIEYKSPPTPA